MNQRNDFIQLQKITNKNPLKIEFFAQIIRVYGFLMPIYPKDELILNLRKLEAIPGLKYQLTPMFEIVSDW